MVYEMIKQRNKPNLAYKEPYKCKKRTKQISYNRLYICMYVCMYAGSQIDIQKGGTNKQCFCPSLPQKTFLGGQKQRVLYSTMKKLPYQLRIFNGDKF